MVLHRLRRYRYANTRQFLRLPAAWPLKLELKGTDQTQVTLTRDVSAGGLGLSMRVAFPAGSQFHLELNVPPLKRTIAAEAEVVRISGRRDQFELGLRFVRIDPEDRTALNEAIEQFLSPRERARHQQSWWRKLP